VTGDFLAAGDGLRFSRRLKQWQSAGDGLALKRLALTKNGGGLGVYFMGVSFALLCSDNAAQFH